MKKQMRLLFLILLATLTTGCDSSSSSSSASTDGMTLKPVFTGLNQPVYLTSAHDGSNRIFIVEKEGLIKVAKDGAILDTPFLDILSRTSRGAEQGLFTIAFSPNFKTDKRFFINYTDTHGDTVVSRWEVSAENPDRADGGSEKMILQVPQPFANHNGGCLQFGPDGMLYIGLGDGGSGGDPKGNGQNLNALLGKMLRIDVSGSAGYTVPSDNPFVGREDIRGEVWAAGLRNPWRYSFDMESGRLFAGDVGQNKFEEIDIIERGKNYGWNIMEAGHCYQEQCSTVGLELPIAEYGRDEGISVTGGYVYRGDAVPELAGKYIFGDFGSGNIWTLTERSGKWDRQLLIKKAIAISSFGEDDQKNLYVVDFAGGIYRFEK